MRQFGQQDWKFLASHFPVSVASSPGDRVLSDQTAFLGQTCFQAEEGSFSPAAPGPFSPTWRSRPRDQAPAHLRRACGLRLRRLQLAIGGVFAFLPGLVLSFSTGRQLPRGNGTSSRVHAEASLGGALSPSSPHPGLQVSAWERCVAGSLRELWGQVTRPLLPVPHLPLPHDLK